MSFDKTVWTCIAKSEPTINAYETRKFRTGSTTVHETWKNNKTGRKVTIPVTVGRKMWK